jgi:RNA polymerase sigma-70 factor (ECF subfamily)
MQANTENTLSDPTTEPIETLLDRLYRSESRRVLATLIRLLGDFDLAEEALHDAFRAALEQWPRDSIPANPRIWLVSAGRFKAIDTLCRRTRFEAALPELADPIEHSAGDPALLEEEELADDRLRLVFTSCHPALQPHRTHPNGQGTSPRLV